MLFNWKKWLSDGKSEGGVNSERNLQRSACALLLEIAQADNMLKENELQKISEALIRRFDLDEQAVGELIEEAEAIRASATDLWQFARVINDGLTPNDKIRLMEDIWRVIYADGALEAHENHLAHRITDILRLNHRQFIDAKLRVQAEMAG